MWRTGTDIAGNWGAVLDRADVADKWAPLAGPTHGWNEPDMINVTVARCMTDGALTLAENRAYFGLWAIIKAPLLLSANLRELDAMRARGRQQHGAHAVNQNALGVAARKLAVDGAPLIHGSSGSAAPPRRRLIEPAASPREVDDNCAWDVVAPADGENGTHLIRFLALPGRSPPATGAAWWRAPRVVAQPDAVQLLPCNASAARAAPSTSGLNTRDDVTSALTGAALAVSNGSSSRHHATATCCHCERRRVRPLGARRRRCQFDQAECDGRDCQNYEPCQMWYWSPRSRCC